MGVMSANLEKFIAGNHSLQGKDLFLFTREGVVKVEPKDWIIKGIENELYPCKPEIFNKTYEQADPEIN
jgi:hypothetical protein